MPVAGFAFTKLIVSDLQGLERFYSEGLGCRVVTRIAVDHAEWPLDETILTLGTTPGTTLNLVCYRDRPAPAAGEAVIGLAVNDIQSVVDQALAAGASLYLAVQNLPDHGVKLAYIQDPEGHLIELLEYLGDPATV